MLTSLLVIATLAVGIVAPSNNPTPCTSDLVKLGLCNVTNSGTDLTISAKKTTPGTSAPKRDSTGSPVTESPPPPPNPLNPANCLKNWDSENHCFRKTTETPDPADPAIPPITITDLAQFAPDPVAATAEPANMGIAGMPTNFVATASVITRTGTLFGYPITVRFTPSAYDFHFGDATNATTRTGGQTWAQLGQAQFTPTPTSHVYSARGTYLADVDVRYTAEVNLGGGWFPVAGELTADGPAEQIRIFEAHTALVARTCDEQPTAPGC